MTDKVPTPVQVRASRALLGVSQTDFGELAGIARVTLSRLERGLAVHPETLGLLREALPRMGIELIGTTGVRLADDVPPF